MTIRNKNGRYERSAEDLSGKKFGRLLVLRYNGTVEYSGRMRPSWVCRCSCGNEVIVKSAQLLNGNKRSCNCLKNELSSIRAKGNTYRRSKDPEKDLCNYMYKRYKIQATKRGIDFSLTNSEVGCLFKNVCHYCGTSPSNICIRPGKSFGSFTYNGIDRVDNNKGYTIENCVACCKRCNYSKSNYTKDDFLNWISSVYNYSVNKNGLD